MKEKRKEEKEKKKRPKKPLFKSANHRTDPKDERPGRQQEALLHGFPNLDNKSNTKNSEKKFARRSKT